MANAAQLTKYYVRRPRLDNIPDPFRRDFHNGILGTDDVVGAPGNGIFYGSPVLGPSRRGRLIHDFYVYVRIPEDDSSAATTQDMDLYALNFGNDDLTDYNTATAVIPAFTGEDITQGGSLLLGNAFLAEIAEGTIQKIQSDDGLAIYVPPFHALYFRSDVTLADISAVLYWGTYEYAPDGTGVR